MLSLTLLAQEQILPPKSIHAHGVHEGGTCFDAEQPEDNGRDNEYNSRESLVERRRSYCSCREAEPHRPKL
jgi:hypothetical protein